jgi:hypothetical protein
MLNSANISVRPDGLQRAYLLAVEAGDDSLASEFSTELIARTTAGNSDAFRAALRCLEPAIQAGRPEAAELLNALKSKAGYGTAPKGSDNGNQLLSCERQLQLAKGDLQSWVPVAWLDADRSSPGQATIAWDIGPANGFAKDRITAPLNGTPLPQFEGKLGLELLFSEDGESMESLASLPAVGARGAWQGRLPASAGFVRAVITDADGVRFGSLLPVFSGVNLLAAAGEPHRFWGFPSDSAKVVPGGPAVNGNYVAWEYDEPIERRADATLVGRKIALKPGHDYFLGGWVRAAWRANLEHVNLGWRTYDRAGKLLAEESLRVVPSGKRFWHFQGQRLRRPAGDGATAQLPAEAVWIEPIVKQGRTDFDLAGLSLVEIPPEPAAN